MIEELSFNEDCIESLFLRSTSKRGNFIVGNIYRSPSGNLTSLMKRISVILELISVKFPSYSVYLLGDYNIGPLKVNYNAKYFEYYSLMSSHGLIDQVWCNTSVSTSSGVILSDISDHFLSFCSSEGTG